MHGTQDIGTNTNTDTATERDTDKDTNRDTDTRGNDLSGEKGGDEKEVKDEQVEERMPASARRNKTIQDCFEEFTSAEELHQSMV